MAQEGVIEESFPPAADEELSVQEEEEGDDEEEENDEEYNVEDIRGKRINPKTKQVEYLIKWENYPESQNTWEPADHVMCPDLIIKFNEREENKKKKRRRGSAASSSTTSDSHHHNHHQQQHNNHHLESKRPKTTTDTECLLIEDDDETNSSTIEDQAPSVSIPKQPTGFERGTPIENIVGSCTDDGEKLYFFVQFSGAKEIDLVDYEEIATHAPRKLCDWYKQRQYELIAQQKDDSS